MLLQFNFRICKWGRRELFW